MDLSKNKFARRLLKRLATAGSTGVRMDKLDRKLLDANLLTVLDADLKIEFGRVSHSVSNVSKSLSVGTRVEWGHRWAGYQKKPIAEFMPELLKREPEVLRPWIRLTSKGCVLNSTMEIGSDNKHSDQMPSKIELQSYLAYQAAESFLVNKHNVKQPSQNAIFQILSTSKDIEGVPEDFVLQPGESAFLKAYRRAKRKLSHSPNDADN